MCVVQIVNLVVYRRGLVIKQDITWYIHRCTSWCEQDAEMHPSSTF